MQLVGANPNPAIGSMDELPGKANYFIGRDPKKWRTNVPLYAKVQYREVYPKTDVVYYGNQGRLEYDFIVGPGADPAEIRLALSANNTAQSERQSQSASPDLFDVHIDTSGDLVVSANGQEVRYQKPVAYQQIPGSAQGEKQFVDVRYVLRPENEIGFETGPYDTSLPLVIDPVLVYSTYVAGSDQDQAYAIAVDSSGSAYITGITDSPDFPTTTGAYQTSCGTDGTCNASGGTPSPTNTNYDVFVTKLNLEGSQLVYSTFLGGSGQDVGLGIAVDASGSAYVTGYTESPDFPVTPGAFQTGFAPGISPGVYSAAESTDVCGAVYSYTVPDNALNGFVTKLNPAGNGLAYSTFLGGTQSDQLHGIAVDSTGEAYVTGISTSHEDFQSYCTNPAGVLTSVYTFAYPTTPNAFLAAPPGPPTSQTPPWPPENYGAVFSKLSSDGSTLLYSTYLEGEGLAPNQGAATYGLAIAVDSSGDAYLTGQTNSPTFPTTSGVVQPSIGGTVPAPDNEGPNYDAFVSKFDPTQTGPASLIYSTYLGGPSNDYGYGIAVDPSGNAYVTGVTGAALGIPAGDGFPTTPGSFQPTCLNPNCSSGYSGFVTELNSTATSLTYSTYLGGSEGQTNLYGIAVDIDGRASVTGITNDPTFPTTANAIYPSITGTGPVALVSTFTPDGSGLVFSTYLGGSLLYGYGIALDPSANIYITGSIINPSLPVTAGAYQTSCAKCGTTNYSYGAFVAEISAPVTEQTAPTISWPTPAAITYGTALSATQLDATANVPGTFVYSPPAGTVLGAGSQTLMVQFTPNDTTDYSVANFSVTLVVNSAPLTVTANNAAMTYGGSLPVFTAGYSGFVNGDTAAVLSGSPSLTTSATSASPVGTYTITAAQGTLTAANYTFAFVNGTLTITKASPMITWNAPAAITYGTTLSTTQLDASANVPGTFAYSPVAGTVLGAGTSTLNVTFTPTDSTDYSIASANVSIIVNKASSTTNLVSSPNPSSPGQAVTLTATIVPQLGGTATGSVTFTDSVAGNLGMADVAGNVATLSTTALTATGSHSITATYSGDSNVLGSTSGTLMQTVNQLATTTTLVSSVNPSYVTQQVTFTATVIASNGTPATGTVTFEQGKTVVSTATLTNGVATYSVTFTTAGSRTFTAVYAANGPFLGSTSQSLTQTVRNLPAATTTVVTSSGSPSYVGQAVVFTAQVSSTFGPIPNGETIAFTDGGGTTIGTGTTSEGEATLTYSGLAAGSHAIRAAYPGDSTFAASTSTAITQVVDKYPTSTSLVSSLNPSTYGQSVTLTATVVSTGPNTPTGNVTFENGTMSLGTVALNSSGVATLTLSDLPGGTLLLTASYKGDTESATSSGALSQTVNMAVTTTTLTSSKNPSTSGQSVKFTATVTSPTTTPTGTVTFSSGTTTLGTATLSGGKASLTTTALPVGADPITVTYSGTANITGSSASLTQQVN